MKKRGFWLILVLLFLSLATPVLADGPDGDVVIWGKSYTLASGENIKGDLLVYGGNVTLEPESEVKGDVTVFGGTLTLAGQVDGDVSVWGGDVNITADATVRGDVMSVGGKLNRHSKADIRGHEIEGFPFDLPKEPKLPQRPEPPKPPKVPPAPSPDRGNGFLKGIGGFFRSVFGIVLMMVLGILVVAFIPRHTETVAETMVRAPVKSLLSGLVALVGGSVILLMLVLVGALLTATICLAPIGLAMFLPVLVAGIALLFGWIAAGLLLGTKILRALKKDEPVPVTAVAVGMLALSLLSAIPCIGWALALVTVVWSLGAVVHSLFGTRPWDSPATPGPTGAADADGLDQDYDPRMDKL
jgi:hypothetical protein